MKKIVTILLTAFLFVGATKAQYVNIPDANFKIFLQNKYPTAFNGAGQMDTANSLIVGDTSLDCSQKNISSIDGIQYFDNLRHLNISNNSIVKIKSLPAYLNTFILQSVPIDTLPPLPNGLISLSMSVGLINYISWNYYNNNGYPISTITYLPLLPASLKELIINAPFLQALPSLPNGLEVLRILSKQSINLNSLPDSLKQLSLFNLPISSLPMLPSKLELLEFDSTNIHCLPKLPNTLQVFNFTLNSIACIPNVVNGLSIYTFQTPFFVPTTLPVCNPTNNPNNCLIYNPYVNIPDTSFGKFLLAQYPSCLYKDASNLYWMDTTCGAVVSENSLSCPSTQIQSVNGVEYFKNLKYLYCYFNSISSLSKLPSYLQELWVQNNLITTLPALPSSLKVLFCNFNKLTSLPTLPDSLWGLVCDNNKITALPSLPNSLASLQCDNNLLTNLPLLDDSLTHLICNDNLLTTLPSLPSKLYLLNCYSNKIYCLPKLPNSLSSLQIDASKIKCLPNQVNALLVYDSMQVPFPSYISVPICSPSNNANHCQSFPTVYGKVFTDANSNGIKDTNEFYRPFVKVTLNTGEVVYTNQYGAYAITTDSIGDYTLKATAPAYFKAVPDSNNFTFTQYQTTLTLADIALQPLVAKDSFAIAATAFINRPRPGFNYTYNVAYGNVGTVSATTNNIVSFTFDSSRLVFDSASVAVQSVVGGNQILVNAGALVAGQGGIFNLYFTVKTTAVIGDSIKALAAITFSGTQLYSYYVAAIVGSFDPNDKQATPELSPTQVANGEYIDYTIRFQNVGNAEATNVVIADTLSHLLQQYNLKMVAASHNPNITIGNGIIYFEFLNINLPDSHTNNLMSNGFVKFKLKPINAVALGTQIPNKASIYFDYNSAVTTNIASTIIKVVTVPVKIRNWEIGIGNWEKEKAVLCKWAVGVETNVSHYNIQRSLTGSDFATIGQVKAINNNSYNFSDNQLPITHNQLTIYYRLMIVEKDGSIAYSEIRSIQLNDKQETLQFILTQPKVL